MGSRNLQTWRFIIGFEFDKIHVHMLNDSNSPAKNIQVGASKIGRVEVLVSYSTGDGSKSMTDMTYGGFHKWWYPQMDRL